MINKAKNNFWQELKKAAPGRSARGGQAILALAPMAGITDSAFRQICKGFGADVVYSEMASAAALCYNPKKTLEMLVSDKNEAPYVIQLFGSKPEHFVQAVKLLTDKELNLKFKIKNLKLPQGIDLNFGCPVKKVAKQGAGAVLMDKPEGAREIVKAVLGATDLPVSIKIRTRSGKTDALKFLDALADLPLAAVMIHGRTMSAGHSGAVDWQMIKQARNHFSGVILANGGVVDAKSAAELLAKTGADGLGIARGALGRPWIFEEVKSEKSCLAGGQVKVQSRDTIIKIALKHAELADKLKGKAGIVEMRKHLCWYVAGQPDAGELRRRLVQVSNLKEIKEILR
jgi:nifR3 family TIM-barrel protein